MDGEEICLCRSRMAFHGFYLVLKKGGRDGTDGSWERLGSFSTNSWDFPRQFLSRVFLPMVTIFHHFSMVIYRYIWLCLDIYIYIGQTSHFLKYVSFSDQCLSARGWLSALLQRHAEFLAALCALLVGQWHLGGPLSGARTPRWMGDGRCGWIELGMGMDVKKKRTTFTPEKHGLYFHGIS